MFVSHWGRFLFEQVRGLVNLPALQVQLDPSRKLLLELRAKEGKAAVCPLLKPTRQRETLYDASKLSSAGPAQ